MHKALLASVLIAGCSATPRSPPSIPDAGAQIYVGSVSGNDGQPMFRYTRDVQTRGDAQLSVHRSHAVADGELVVVDAAEHDDRYRLRRFVEQHHQLGLTSEVRVEADGSLAFTTYRSRRVRTRTEAPRDPAVVGPTLFGFVLTHWSELAEGTTIPVRFVVAERGRSYAFNLRMTKSRPDTTVVEMTAKSPLLRLSVRPMRMTFDTQTRSIVRYEGRIPPRWNNRPVDARVDYELTAPYR